MSRVLSSVEMLPASSMSYATTCIHAHGEVDRFVLDCGIHVEIELTPGPGEDRFTMLSFDELRISGADGQELAVFSKAGDRLDEEALQAIIWEQLEASVRW